MTPLRITCHLAGSVAQYAPALDALLIELATNRLRVPPCERPTRLRPAPDPRAVPDIPLGRKLIGGWPVYQVSAPILPTCLPRVAHFGKRIDTSRAGLLAPAERKTVVTSNTWTKSYRLPVKVLHASRVVWFAVGDRAGLLDALAACLHIGRKPAHGWGRVDRWEVEEAEADWSWYAPGDGRPVLMRVLPLCPELPASLDGWRQDFGAVCPPYWHPDRHTECVTPC